jgi:hypothetical protein
MNYKNEDFFFGTVLEFELGTSHLLSSVALYTQATPLAFFALVIFKIGFHIFVPAGLYHNPIYVSDIGGMTGTMLSLLVEMGSC